MTKLFNSLHFLYASLLSLIIFTAALSKTHNLTQWLTLLLFLPILFHFLVEIYKKIYLFNYRLHHPTPPLARGGADPNNFAGLNFRHFLTQEEPAFLVSLGLLCLLISTTILKFLFNQ